MIRGLRWWIAGLIFLATLITFLNRLVIAVLGPVITRDPHLSASQFAGLTIWFLAAYTISQLVSGRLYDRIGTKRGFVVSIVVWSLASMAHAAARGLFALNCFRFVLGLVNSGISIGSVVATPLIIMLQGAVGWQATFVAMGSLGFVWLALWLRYYEAPERHPTITAEELAVIQEGREKRTGGERCFTWVELLRHREIAAFAWLPFVAADGESGGRVGIGVSDRARMDGESGAEIGDGGGAVRISKLDQ